jgi:putative transposase
MNRPPAPNLYKRHRFPVEIISHCVWLYCRFCLSYRDVEELMAERRISLTYEAVRYWCREFGQAYARALRRRPRSGDKRHLDEVFLTIHGERHYLWRAVDQDGHMLDILVQRSRNKRAAKKFFRKLLKGCQDVPRVLITDKLASYGAAKREMLPSVEHRQHRYLNNRPASGSGACRGSSRRVMRSASARDGTSSPPPNTAKSWGNGSTPGTTSRAVPPQHKRCAPDGHAPFSRTIPSTDNKLTTPCFETKTFGQISSPLTMSQDVETRTAIIPPSARKSR